MGNLQARVSPEALAILARLNSAGEAYLVGGVVRDLMLGLRAEDEDICTSLRPEAVQELFAAEQLQLSGLKHGTVGVIRGAKVYEITTFRQDGPYPDHRHPQEVCFTASLEEDLARRDFTINAMALAADGRLYDPFGGREDLQRGCIRAVGDPPKRFSEDALRLLRAVRFANRLHFHLEEKTAQALREKAPLLQEVSAERKAQEFLKILGDDPEGVTMLHKYGLLPYCFPELEACFLCAQEMPWHLYDVGRHSVATAKAYPDLLFRLAAICHDLGKPVSKTYKDGRAHFYGHAEQGVPIAREMLARLFLPKAEQTLIAELVRWHDFISVRPSKIARLLRTHDETFFPLLLRLQRADILAQSSYQREEKLARLARLTELYKHFAEGPHRLQDLAVRGSELAACGIRGAAIGRTLQELLAFVMQYPEKNRHDILIKRVQSLRAPSASHPRPKK